MEHAEVAESTARPPLEKIWEFEAGGSIEPHWKGLFVAYGMVYFGRKDGCISALEVTSGREIWKFKMGRKNRFPLVVSDGLVYAASDDKSIYAIDAKTGEKRWQFSKGKDISHRPVTANGLVYAATKDKRLYALDSQTGQERWQFSTGKDISPPGVGGGLLCFGSEDQKVYALDARNGEKKWDSKTGHKRHSLPVFVNDKVLISGDKNLYAFNTSTGTILWVAKNTSHGAGRTPIIANGFALCHRDFTVLSLADGTVLERISPGKTAGDIAVRDGVIYVSSMGALYASNLATRKTIWYAPIDPGSALGTFFVLAKDFAFVVCGTRNGLLSAISISRPLKRWEHENLSKGVFDDVSPPVIADDMVIVSRGKEVTAFRSLKDPSSKRLLEVGDDIASSPKYTATILFPGKPAFLLQETKTGWPDYCCLCCGPVEKRVNLTKSEGRTELRISGIPYCKRCFENTKGGVLRKAAERPGVEITKASPPTLTFRNEKYWAMFSEVNGLR
ncbi:MAG: PQQ-binding-like beta-propeller repeat protein [Promethearchaeota archaeon]